MKTYLVIKGDHNDADYVHEITDITACRQEVVELINRILPHLEGDENWPNAEGCDESPEEKYKGKISEDDIDHFQEFVPTAEYGIHTIEKIHILEVAEEQILYIS